MFVIYTRYPSLEHPLRMCRKLVGPCFGGDRTWIEWITKPTTSTTNTMTTPLSKPKRYRNIERDRKGILVMMKVKVFSTTWLKCKLFLIVLVKGMPSFDFEERERGWLEWGALYLDHRCELIIEPKVGSSEQSYGASEICHSYMGAQNYLHSSSI